VTQPAVLALADGTLFHGRSIGIAGRAAGEVVFNTAMTGYQEILTDPSYAWQIVTLTYPHIGNVGTTPEDEESAAVQAAGLVIRDLPLAASNWRLRETLPAYLERHRVVAIADLDTRALTRRLREQGAQAGCIAAGEAAADVDAAIAAAHGFPGLSGRDIVRTVSCRTPYAWNESVWSLAEGHPAPGDPAAARFHVIAYDFGTKRNILRLLVERGCRLTVVPAETTAEQALALEPDGVFLSNGPGDPEPCAYAIEATRRFLDAGVPLFGICLGHQFLGLACGGRSRKMKFGHHGANHPVRERATGKVMISSQNHGFAIDADSLPDSVEVTHESLFDGSLQGIHHRERPAFSFQGHPEASPGPHDMRPLFDHFIDLMTAHARR